MPPGTGKYGLALEAGRGPIAIPRDGSATEVQGPALRVGHDLHGIRVQELFERFNRSRECRDVGPRVRFQQLRHLLDQGRRDQRLVALHVHDDLVRMPRMLACHLSDAIGPGSVRSGRHDDLGAERMTRAQDQVIVGSNQHVVSARGTRALVYPLHHRFAADGHERLAWETRRGVARGYDNTEHLAYALSARAEDRRPRVVVLLPPA